MNRYRIIIPLIIMLIVTSSSYGGLSKSISHKMLPLDMVPNIVMKTPENSKYLPDRVIVRLKSAPMAAKTANRFGMASLDNFIQRYSVRSIENVFKGNMIDAKGQSMDMSRFYVIKYSSPIDAFKVAKELSQQPDVLYAEPWFIYSLDDVTACSVNDTYRNNQWGLTKILADSAWCVSSGDTSVVIGIVDSGVQWNHPDLQGNIFINPGEWGPDGKGGFKQSNGIDDDGNGLVDDWHGWDFGGGDYLNPIADNDPSPTSTNGAHGTHVAGIASAVTNNSTGVAGIAYKCKLLPVKVISDNDPSQFITFGMEGIFYAAMMGAKIINCSWGGPGGSQFEQEIIDTVTAHGSLVVAAAGNTYGYQSQFPASYRGVISVAATTNTDERASFSSYSENVDVSAPGYYIYSTYYPSSYAYLHGTSMASPLVAGLAALVASKFPSYTGLQIGEQVRVTTDNIDGINPTVAGLIGKGRINAYRALTEFSPSLRVISTIINDSLGGNNNKNAESNEDITLTTNIINYLQPSSPVATMSITTTDTNIQIITSSYPIGYIGTKEIRNNADAPFQIHIKNNVPAGHIANLKLSIGDGSYSDYQIIPLMINSPYATHNVNNIEVSLTNRSRIGFVDETQSAGAGFVYGSGNQLYEGGLIIGNSSTKLVDVIRNATSQDSDFVSSQIYNLITPGSLSAQEGSTIFTDAAAPAVNKIGLQVKMYSYAFSSLGDSNFILLRYDIKNTSGTDIMNLYAGLFFDWDIYGPQTDPWNYNKTSFDSLRSAGYAWNIGNSNTVYCGARAFDGTTGYRALIRTSIPDLSRSTKWSWINGGVVYADTMSDIHFTLSSGPFDITNGGTKMIGFALIGGKNLTDFQLNADAALIKWNYIKNAVGVQENKENYPTNFALKQNYPNPFNPSTTISYDLPKNTLVALKIYDILGREVMVIVNSEQPAGRYSVRINASSLSSGMYFYRLLTPEFSDMKKLLIIR